jgi:hypothetical protein
LVSNCARKTKILPKNYNFIRQLIAVAKHL